LARTDNSSEELVLESGIEGDVLCAYSSAPSGVIA